MNDYISSVGIPKTVNINSYRKAKLKMLKRDFRINLTDEEIDHVNQLTTEIAIDNFCISAIDRRWN